ncbi:hypothetical protein FXO38_14848 [Capsicum annuum]|nr:hypothetical protein FXO38_14848 [Capsicum annuum]KAF3657228.1 hypothetical protein FXO37_15058 [Capsicum annuum]
MPIISRPWFGSCHRTMLIDSGLPKSFWAESINPTYYVTNRCLMRSLLNKTLYELVFNRNPNLDYFSLFGYLGDGKDSEVEELIPVQRDDIAGDDDRWINDGDKNDESDGEGIDYDETFSPVARLEAIGIFVAFAAYMGFKLYTPMIDLEENIGSMHKLENSLKERDSMHKLENSLKERDLVLSLRSHDEIKEEQHIGYSSFEAMLQTILDQVTTIGENVHHMHQSNEAFGREIAKIEEMGNETNLSNTITFPTFQDGVDQEEKPCSMVNDEIGSKESSVIFQLTKLNKVEEAKIEFKNDDKDPAEWSDANTGGDDAESAGEHKYELSHDKEVMLLDDKQCFKLGVLMSQHIAIVSFDHDRGSHNRKQVSEIVVKRYYAQGQVVLWKKGRGEDATPMTWQGFQDSFLDKFFSLEMREANVEEFINLRRGSVTVKAYYLKFNQLAKYAPDLIADPRVSMSKFMTGVSELVLKECRAAMLNKDMDHSSMMIHAQHIKSAPSAANSSQRQNRIYVLQSHHDQERFPDIDSEGAPLNMPGVPPALSIVPPSMLQYICDVSLALSVDPPVAPTSAFGTPHSLCYSFFSTCILELCSEVKSSAFIFFTFSKETQPARFAMPLIMASTVMSFEDQKRFERFTRLGLLSSVVL